MKPIIMERVSYSIQFEAGIETLKSLKFNKISQASEQIIIDVSGSGEHESKKIRKFRKKLAMSKSPPRKIYGFSNDSNEKNIMMKLGIWNTEIVAICLLGKIYHK